MKPKYSAFTLIELLIVVAIIAILAAIAVPNFLEAQVRSKVSRVKADMRSIATALESYRVDNNHYCFDWAGDVAYPYYLHQGLTTPISYMTNAARMHDVFAEAREPITNPNEREVRRRFRYRALGEKWMAPASEGGLGTWSFSMSLPGIVEGRRVHGDWLLVSKGPWGKLNLPVGFPGSDGANETDWLWLLYDPTNGTRSTGEVIRNQKLGDANAAGYDRYAADYYMNP